MHSMQASKNGDKMPRAPLSGFNDLSFLRGEAEVPITMESDGDCILAIFEV